MPRVRQVVNLAPAAIAALDAFVKGTPVPADHAILLKLPAAVICSGIAWFAIPPKSKRSALAAMIVGAVLLTTYVFFTLASLHSNPQFYQPGDNSVIGFWLSDGARQLIKEEHITEETLRDRYGPENWNQVYSQVSQLTRSAAMSVLYCLTFASFTFALKKL
jgi:hypothetical protein